MKKHLLIFWFICAFTGMYAQVNEQINIDLSKIKVEVKGEFVELSFPDAQFMEEVGSPRLPFITQSFIVPVNAEVTGVKINSQTKQKLSGSFYIYPAQAPMPTGINDVSQDFTQNQTLYNSSNPFPSDRVKILFDGFDHGYHIVTVGIYPFEYISLSREVHVYNINFSLTYSATHRLNGVNKAYNQTQRETSLIKNHIKSIVKNKGDINAYSPETEIISLLKNVRTQQIMLRAGQATSVIETIIPKYLIYGRSVANLSGNLLFSERDYLAPVPLVQIRLNPQLKQNPGW